MIGKDGLVKHKEWFYSANTANFAQQLIRTVLTVLFAISEYIGSFHKSFASETVIRPSEDFLKKCFVFSQSTKAL